MRPTVVEYSTQRFYGDGTVVLLLVAQFFLSLRLLVKTATLRRNPWTIWGGGSVEGGCERCGGAEVSVSAVRNQYTNSIPHQRRAPVACWHNQKHQRVRRIASKRTFCSIEYRD